MDQPNQPEPGPTEFAGTVDELKLQLFTQQLRDNQSLSFGLLAGLVAATLGAGLWAAVTYFTGYQIGWMAVGIGFAVGYAVRRFGQGIDNSFAISGATLALFGCLLGNLLTVCLSVAEYEGVSLTDVLSRLDTDLIGTLMVETFHPMDLLFYGIAVYQGYKLSIRSITDEEMGHLMK